MNSTPRIIEIKEKKLVGVSCNMSITNNRTGELWSGFRPKVSEISQRVSPDFISLQNYPEDYFVHFDPNKPFEKWAAVEVSQLSDIPNGMQSLVVPSGLYAVFDYRGSSRDAGIFQFIFGEWLPNSPYAIDSRPHYEVLGKNYKNNDPCSEEEIWIPILTK